MTAPFGRSGSGQDSLVNIIAGLLRPDQGRVVLDGDTIADSERRLFTPVHRRRFALCSRKPPLSAFQRPQKSRLWPLVRRRGPIGPEFGRIVEMPRHRHLLDRMPSTLSGGERQRRRPIAGRCSLPPACFLMDEPLAALDDRQKGRNPALSGAACATRRGFRSSMSVIRWLKWRGWRSASVVMENGRVKASAKRRPF